MDVSFSEKLRRRLLRWHRRTGRIYVCAVAVAAPLGIAIEYIKYIHGLAPLRLVIIQGALKNVGHRVGRATIARTLKARGLPRVPERPTSWQTFLRAYWGAIGGADFFTTEVGRGGAW